MSLKYHLHRLSEISEKGSQDFFILSAWLYNKWDVKNDFAYVLQFFSLISDGLGGVELDFRQYLVKFRKYKKLNTNFKKTLVSLQKSKPPTKLYIPSTLNTDLIV